MRRDDRDLAPRQRIHQRRLADVRRTRDRDHQPLAQPFTSPLCRKDFFDLAEQRFDFCNRRRDQFGRHVTFVGEIDAGFDQRRGLDDLIAPVARAVAEQTVQLTQRLAALPVGVGMNQIVEAFGFGEIELAILERAPGELARLRGAHIGERRERREQRRQHRAPAMNMKFRDILAGRAGRARKPQHHGVVDRLPIRIAQQGPRRHPRRRHLARKRNQCGPGLRSGYPDDRNRARRPARRKGKNGLFARMHRLFVPEPSEKATLFPPVLDRGAFRAKAPNGAAILQHSCSIYAAATGRLAGSATVQ